MPRFAEIPDLQPSYSIHPSMSPDSRVVVTPHGPPIEVDVGLLQRIGVEVPEVRVGPVFE